MNIQIEMLEVPDNNERGTSQYIITLPTGYVWSLKTSAEAMSFINGYTQGARNFAKLLENTDVEIIDKGVK